MRRCTTFRSAFVRRSDLSATFQKSERPSSSLPFAASKTTTLHHSLITGHSTGSMADTGTTNEGTSASNLLATPVPTPTGSARGARFWLIFLALGFSLFLSPLELVGPAVFIPTHSDSYCTLQTSTSTALPSIIQDLNGNDFIWIASSYTLSSTAILPMSGGLAEVRAYVSIFIRMY